jgi:CRISPR system Cascade subunit CasC
VNNPKFLHIHAIWPASGALLNADREGKAKTITYGGVTRLTVSSQAWKRRTREELNEGIEPGLRGLRSRFYTIHAADRLVNTPIDGEAPWSQEEAEGVCAAIHQVLTGGEGNALVFLASDAVARCADIARRMRTELAECVAPAELDDKATKAEQKAHKEATAEAAKAAKALRKNKTILSLLDCDGSVDIALNGRMIAANAKMNVDAAVHVAIAKSVEQYVPGSDDFTAREDLPHSRDDRTASDSGMIERRHRGGGTLYRYAVINMDQLQTNLPDVPWKQLVDYAIQWANAFITSIPVASQSSTAANGWPTMVMMQPSTSPKGDLYEQAFAKPVNRYDDEPDFSVAAAQRIVNTHTKINQWFGRHGTAYALLPEGTGDVDAAATGITVVDDFAAAIDAIRADFTNTGE